MNINEELRRDMLIFFQEPHTIERFCSKYPQYVPDEVKEMRQSLMRADDIRRIYGLTRATLYRTTPSGISKAKNQND